MPLSAQTVKDLRVFANQVRLAGDFTLVLDANNLNNIQATGGDEIAVLRLDATGTARSVTGFAGGADGRLLLVLNVGTADTITIVDQSASSSAANRVRTPNAGGLAVRYGGGALLVYDAVTSRWHSVAASL